MAFKLFARALDCRFSQYEMQSPRESFSFSSLPSDKVSISINPFAICHRELRYLVACPASVFVLAHSHRSNAVNQRENN